MQGAVFFAGIDQSTVRIEQVAKSLHIVLFFSIVFFLLGAGIAWAQGRGESSSYAPHHQVDTLSLQVYFRRGVSAVDPGYRGNGERLAAFKSRLDEALRDTNAVVRTIIIRSSASPEGSSTANQLLSENRARGIETWLSDSLHIDPSLFRFQPIGEDWEGLRKLIGPLDVPWKEEALLIMDATRDNDVRKQKLKQLEEGQAWRWMDEHLFPDLRLGGGSVSCVIYQRDTVYIEKYIEKTVTDTVLVVPPAVVPEEKPNRYEGKRMLFAVRTNALAVPLANVGVEVPLGERWSVAADYYYPWFWRPKHGEGLDYAGRCFEMLALDVEGRYWWPSRNKAPEQRLLGHSVGLYAAVGYYDFEQNATGHQGEFFNVGVDYLYAMPIFRGRMHLEFELGLGYIRSVAQPYDNFILGDKCYRRKGIKQNVNWVGPTRAQISLVVPIYVKKKNAE